MPDPTDLVTWLRAQLDADEFVAAAAIRTDGRGGHWVSAGLDSRYDARVDDHVARWDPARVLAEVAAKRAILDAYTEAVEFYNANRHHPAGEVHGLWTALRWLALPYASNPGYDESWRPA